MDFPGDCSTNGFVLDGFAQIIYMVSTVAGQNTKPEGTAISLLQNAERALRTQASILVALDHDTNELFTFYRSGDIQRNAKQIFGKLRTVLMDNSCMLSFKSGLKANDLATKEEHSRLYRFFISAVFLALRSNFVSSSEIIPLGFRSFLQNVPPLAITPDISDGPQKKQWQISIVDLQLLSNGQLLIFNETRVPSCFTSISDMLETRAMDDNYDLILRPCSITLAPTGQMGRYTDGRIDSIPTSRLVRSRPDTANSQNGLDPLQDAQMKEWKQQLGFWLVEQGCPKLDWGDRNWIEVEVPFLQDNYGSTPGGSVDNVIWKQLFWPIDLCFSTSPPVPEETMTAYEDSTNPIDFLQDWVTKAENRTRAIASKTGKNILQNDRNIDGHEVGDFDEDLGLDGRPLSQTMLPTNLAPGQMIYPTPPDASLTQPTPGMASMDSVGMTLVDTTRLLSDQVAEQFVSGLSSHAEAEGVGTGMYDEDGDLFEDPSDHQFGATAGGDEPNWDFFEDHPDLDMADIDVSDEISKTEETDEVYVTQTTSEMETERVEDKLSGLMPPPSKITAVNAKANRSSSDNLPDQNSTAEQDTTTVTNPALGDAEEAKMDMDTPSRSTIKPAQLTLSSSMQTSCEGTSDVISIKPEGARRRSSLYDFTGDPISLDDHDERYSTNGMFWFDPDSTKLDKEQADKDAHKQQAPYQGINSGVPSPRSSSDSFEDSDETSIYRMDAKGSPSSVKRKWTEYMQESPLADASPTSDQLRVIETETRRILSLLRPDDIDQTWIFDYLDDFKRARSSESGASESSMIAQVLVDQLSQSCLDHSLGVQPLQRPKVHLDYKSIGQLDGMFGKCERSKLYGLTTTKDTVGNVIDDAGRLLALQPTKICLFKGEKALTLSPTTLPLWETLSLNPNGGEKNIVAFCIHPSGSNYDAGSEFFLDRLGETYMNCNLGRHHIGKIAGMSNNGLFSWSDEDEASPNLQQCCERLGSALARLPPSEDNIVIYMVNGSQRPESYVALIKAFCVLFEFYLKTSDKKAPNEIVLQLVPRNFVASADFLVVPPSREYINLAMEVYNRCPPPIPGERLALCCSAIVLAESPRRRIRFDLASRSGSGTESGGRCLHLAYSRSPSQRWLTAAWTDDRGFIALTTSYCFGTAAKQTRQRIDIIRDMWEVSQELMDKERDGWRLVVAQDGFYDSNEINEWAIQWNDATESSQNANKCILVLISVDLNPVLTLQLTSPQQKTTQGATPQQGLNNYSTPVSTPQASTTSPEQFIAATPTPGGTVPLNAPTPPEQFFDPNNEADLTVLDPTEESWSVTLPYGLNQSNAILELRPALLSSYLMKRRGAKDEDGLIMMGVNLIFAPASHTLATREELLKDTLVQYRGLVTVARTRGCIDALHEVIPWHVATAVKGSRILERLL